MADADARANRPGAQPPVDARCAECREPLGGEWESVRPDAENPQKLTRHFVGVVKAGPIEPRTERPTRPTRAFRYPDDIGAFFHPWCAPHTPLPEKILEEIAAIVAQCFIADREKKITRWAKVRRSLPGEHDPVRFQAQIASIHGHRVFTLARAQWEQLRANEGNLVEIDLARTPTGDVSEFASIIASLAAECSVHTARIEVWRYRENDRPKLKDLDEYLVLENLTPRRLNLPMFAERAKTTDSPRLRKHLREHVFIVKERPDKSRREPKAHARERLVFLNV